MPQRPAALGLVPALAAAQCPHQLPLLLLLLLQVLLLLLLLLLLLACGTGRRAAARQAVVQV